MKWKFGWFCIGVIFICAKLSFAQEAIPLRGSLNFDEHTFFIDVNFNTEKPFRLEVRQDSDSGYQVKLTLTDWEMGFLNISSILEGSLKVVSDDDGKVYCIGNIVSKYTLINDQVVDSVVVDFLLRDQVVTIRSLHTGSFMGSGKINFGDKPEVEFGIKFSELPLKDVLNFLSHGEFIEAEGLVEGELALKGPWKQIKIQGEIHSFKGSVGQNIYNAAEIRFDGTYPKIQIHDAHISQEDGLSFAVQGSLDLSDWEHLDDQMKVFTKSPLITENGKHVDWTFKRLQSEEDGGTTEFKYMLRKDGDREDGILGVERRMKF